MAASGGSGDGGTVSSSFKWQVALAVGVPVAVGVGYWYYRSYKTGGNDENYDRSPRPQGKTFVDDQPAPHSISAEVVHEKTSLQRALAFKEEGNDYFKKGNYTDALRCYQAAIDVGNDVDNTNLATFYQNKAAAHDQLVTINQIANPQAKDYEGVKKDCTMALTLNPQYTKALLRRAKAYEALKNLTKALVDVTAACVLENFQNFSTTATADRILKELGRQHAKEALLQKKPNMPSVYFIKTYFASFSIDPFAVETEINNASKGYLKALHCIQNSDYEPVIGACTEELNQFESDGLFKNEALLLRGTMNILTGQHSEALADLEKVIENNDAAVVLKVNALIKRASIHMQLENPSASMEDFSTAIKLDAENPDIYHQRGQVNLLMEKLEDAHNDFSLAVSNNPKNPILKVQKCYTDYRVAISKNDETKLAVVMTRFETYIREHSTCPECFTLYAQVLSDRREYEKADRLYQKAVDLDPLNATLLVHRAILALQWTGEVNKAIDLIKEALKMDEKCGFACETLGTIQVQMGNLKEGIQMFEKAIEFAKTELELAHLYSLRDATVAQLSVLQKMNLKMPTFDS